MENNGLTTVRSRLSPEETVERLESEIRARSLSVLARIDHAAAAAAAGLSLRPTLLLIFGNAKAGTPLMQAAQSIGIDLPLKFLVWQDAEGATQVSFNQPAWLGERHSVENAKITGAMQAALEEMAKSLV
jgi:uncharacterized protein (DUF302 family)